MSDPTPAVAEIQQLYIEVVQQLSDEIGRGLRLRFDADFGHIWAMSRRRRVWKLAKILIFLDFLMPHPSMLRPGGFLGPDGWPVSGLARVERMSPQTITALIRLNDAHIDLLGRAPALLAGSLVFLTSGFGLIATAETIGVGLPPWTRYVLVAVLVWFAIHSARGFLRVLNWRRHLETVGWVLRVAADLKVVRFDERRG